MEKKQKFNLIRIILSTVILTTLIVLRIDKEIKNYLYLIPYLLIGYDILLEALEKLIKLSPFDECFLMSLATVGAIVLKNAFEGVLVMLLYQIGELFQSIAVGSSKKKINNLSKLIPDIVNLEVEGGEEKVAPKDVKVGSIILVKVGERVSIDGVVVEGESYIDNSALTGESLPKKIVKGENVCSGSINLTGLLKIKTTKEFGQSTISKILELVESATSKKSKSENFITKFAKFYTPIVVVLAVILAFLPPLILWLKNLPTNLDVWLYRASEFLVISCPCALVISIPLSFFVAIGGASKKGILIKGSNYFETLSKLETVAFDKTGTLTEGVFRVEGVHHCPIEDSKLIELVALAESYSNHPIGSSIISSYNKPLDRTRVSDVKEISGQGIIAKVDNRLVFVGNEKLMEGQNVKYCNCSESGSIIHVAIDSEYLGHILIRDAIKKSAKKGIEDLKSVGIKNTIILSGDRQEVGDYVKNKLNIDRAYCELLPQDKVEKIEELLVDKKGNVGFVGDGINDAPVLSRADVGFSMGGVGSDSAIEASDVVIGDDDLTKVAKSIKIAKKCMRIVYENIVFCLGIKLVCLILSSLGVVGMLFAIFADVGVMILAVLNSIRNF